MSRNLIATLKRQHLELKGMLGGIKDKVHSSGIDSREIIARLAKFKTTLKRHLALENSAFYPKLLEKLKRRNLDTSSTEKFIEEMGALEKEILDFIAKYKDGERIEKNKKLFIGELDFIISSLMVRITSEEDGVFLYWQD